MTLTGGRGIAGDRPARITHDAGSQVIVPAMPVELPCKSGPG